MKNRSPEIDFSFCAKRFTSFRKMIFSFSKEGKRCLILSYRDGSVRFTSKGEFVFPQRMPPVVENVITIERHAVHPDFK